MATTPEGLIFRRTAHCEPDFSGLEDGEDREISRYEWLSQADLAATDAVVFPVGLAGVLERLLAGERPDGPIEPPWADRSAR
ncbi:hypothetical protein LO763_07470 [Glycomyces sp. A-F 0318]|uniref:hypothetical protein n=1 Tax=Glycomyces amatae TaxID=2881355 RepID=UPI001E5A17F6|nr:hypothetical protein [Glycomyces amatae]MCD0443464.1 hypothetical protein [Glycomyces amatae]